MDEGLRKIWQALQRNPDPRVIEEFKAVWNRHRISRQEEEIELMIADAITSGRIETHFQPIVDFAINKIVGFEALVRMRDSVIRTDEADQPRMIPTGVFLPVAEKNGHQMRFIDMMVFRDADNFLRELRRAGHECYINVNISKPSLERLENFISEAKGMLGARHAKYLDMLNLEIPETTDLGQGDMRQALATLQQHAFNVYADDFGVSSTNFFTLTAHEQLKGVKIDRSLLVRASEPGGRKVYAEVVRFIKSFDIEVVAEGIETPEQFAFLKEAGVDKGQGFLLGRPLPAGTYLSMLPRPERRRRRTPAPE